jgi:hypothetical protein
MEFNGLPEMPIDGITLTDINIVAQRQTEIHNCRNIKQKNVTVKLVK